MLTRSPEQHIKNDCASSLYGSRLNVIVMPLASWNTEQIVVCSSRFNVTRCSFSWTFENTHFYGARREVQSEVIDSPTFPAGDSRGIAWCLSIGPSGKSDDDFSNVKCTLVLKSAGEEKKIAANYKIFVSDSWYDNVYEFDGKLTYTENFFDAIRNHAIDLTRLKADGVMIVVIELEYATGVATVSEEIWSK